MNFVLKIVGWIILSVILVAGVFVAFNWVPDRSVESLKDRWAQAPSQFVNIAGMQMHLRDEGPHNKLTPIVLLHGTGSSLHTWNGWTDVLKNERRVIRFDLPGFGLTGPAPDDDYTVESYSNTVIKVLDYLQIDSVILAGNSLGGNVAWITAVLNPERVDKLVLVDSSGLPFKAQSMPLGFKIASMPVLSRLMSYVLPRGMIESSVQNVYGNPGLVSNDLVDRYYDLTTRAGNRQALSKRLSQTQPGFLADRLSELKLPTLIMWGEKDRLIPLKLGNQFHQLIVGSQLVLFEQLGHVPQEENPQKTMYALNEFLSQK